MTTTETPIPDHDGTAAKSPAGAASEEHRLDVAIGQLQGGAQAWADLTIGQRARLFRRVRAAVVATAQEWAETAAASKGLQPGHPLAGEEWLSGPYATLVALDATDEALSALAKGESPIANLKLDAAPGGRTRAHVFPTSRVDGLLLSGYTGEVWFQPGVSADDARAEAGLAQLTPTASGGVGLVLGAGNVTSIPVLDVFYELLAHNRTVILKVNPTQDGLVPVYERALAPLIEAGFLRIVRGGGEVGGYLTAHPDIAHVHITGAATTFDAIVWGTGDEARQHRGEDRPQLGKPITAELGGVSPIIIVPGVWTAADLRFHAEHVVTMRLHNSGHNCIAGQVVLLSSDWPQREEFLDALAVAYSAAPSRPVWYPKSEKLLEAAVSDYPEASWCAGKTRAIVRIDEGDNATALQTTEYFSPVLGVIGLPGTGQAFLDAAVSRANDELTGTLGANVLIDPDTQSALGDGFERSICDLRYGSIAINTWTALAFLTPTCTWGAYPGHTLDDVQSGIGVVHNAFLLDRVERSVVRGPFRPFPRSVGALTGPGTFSVLPKPPWFVTSRTGAAVCEGFTRFRMDGNWAKMSATLVQAYRA